VNRNTCEISAQLIRLVLNHFKLFSQFDNPVNQGQSGAGVIDKCSQEDWNASDYAFRVGKEVSDKSENV